MASKPINTDLDFQKVSQLLNVLLHNSSDASIASLLTAQGQLAYTTDSKRIKYWDGTKVRVVLTEEDIEVLDSVGTVKEILLTGNGSSTSLTATHNLNNDYHSITVKDMTTGKVVYPEVTPGLTSDTISWQVAPANGANFRVTIIGIQKSSGGGSNLIGSMVIGTDSIG